jgi:mycothiol synthase
MEDAPAVVDLMNAHDLAETGEQDSSLEDLVADWTIPRFDLTRDAWLVIGPDRRLVGYVWLWDKKPHVEIQADYYIHPTMRGGGLDEPILACLEERALEHRTAAPRGQVVRLRLFNNMKDEPRAALLLARGYERVRTFFRMIIDLRGGFPPARWPQGIVPRAYVPGRDDRAFEETIQESFADHYAFSHEPHAEWAERRLKHPEFAPDLCTLAWDGEVVAGALLPFRFEGSGWVRELGVRPPWRGRGIGRALLLHVFALFAERGLHRVSLGVDALNPTGATQLYESVGMRVTQRYDLHEKGLGEGMST